MFKAEELKALFPAKPSGPWQNLTGYTVFLTAATTGMRRGETRVTPMPKQLMAALKRIQKKSSHVQPNDLVFCYADGARLGGHWMVQ